MLSQTLAAAVLGFALVTAAPINVIDSEFSSLDSIAMLETGTMGGLNISSLQIDAGASRESRLVFGSADQGFSLNMKPDGSMDLNHGDQVSLSVGPNGDMSVFGKLSSEGAVRIDGPLSFRGVGQWQIAVIENFKTGAQGWSNDSTTTCGYGADSSNDDEKKYILGGYSKFAGGETGKVFNNLPPHKYVRLTANYHMIDAWSGETAYAKIEHRLVWTDSFNQESSKAGVNICGSAAPESRFSNPIDVIVPHECNEPCSLAVGFGSTLVGSATEQSWGVSDVMLYIK